jgi:flagellar hook assembly protein FlgD
VSSVQVPRSPTLAQNYPNPFNTSTVVEFTVPERCRVSLEVFNVLGQRVAVLIDDELSAGRHIISWNGRDRKGRPLASGLYFYRLGTRSYTRTRQMILLK